MFNLDKSKVLYTSMFESLNKLYDMGAFDGDEVKLLEIYMRDDSTINSMRWEVDGLPSTMVVPDDHKPELFQLVLETMTTLSKIVDGGFIDNYDYPYVVQSLCSAIERNELPISHDVDLYLEYFDNNSPIAHDDSSY